jgi:hypothetical protein
MTPKEKAKELVNKFCATRLYDEQAKQCALISVDEIIEECVWDWTEYWQEVKQEIEKL